MKTLSIKFCLFIGFNFFIIASFAQNPDDYCKGMAMDQLPNSSVFRDIISLNSNTFVAVGIKRNIPTRDELYLVNLDLCKDTLWTKFFSNQYSLYTGHYIINVDETSFAVVCSYVPDYTTNTYYKSLLLKMNNLGDTLWSKTYSLGSYNNGPACITVTQDGGFIIGGFSDNFPENSSHAQAWIIKTDAEGNIEWSKTYGFDNASEIVRVIIQNSDGTYIVAAQRSHSGTSTLWVFKIDSQGNMLWNRILGNGYWTVGIAMLPAQNGYIIAGLEQPYIWNVGNAFVLKIDTTGTQQWVKYYGDGGMDEFSDMIRLPDDNLIAIGSNSFISGGSYHSDAWLMKLDAEGDSIWSHSYALNGTIPINDYVWGVSQTSEGGFMMAGFTSVFNADSTTLTQTAWVVRTDSLGNSCYIPEGCEWAVGIDSFLPPAPLKRENFIQVYPNPAQNTLQITLPDHSAGSLSGAETSFTLYNLTGQLVLQTQIPAGETHKTVSVAHLPEGVYVYVVTAGEGVLARGKVAVVRK
ncbi:MAG: T9SS type A sorting domain-containing protein [Sphingobacteriales bacterium]|nr:MAG: T9SS type A sorting domain-containing protein [Sphingobacteriales bacterium]